MKESIKGKTTDRPSDFQLWILTSYHLFIIMVSTKQILYTHDENDCFGTIIIKCNVIFGIYICNI